MENQLRISIKGINQHSTVDAFGHDKINLIRGPSLEATNCPIFLSPCFQRPLHF